MDVLKTVYKLWKYS